MVSFSKKTDYFHKNLSFPLKGQGGRNNDGRITVYGRGARKNRMRYRFIDFSRRKYPNILGHVRNIREDPHRSAHIALVCFPNGFITYILATELMEIEGRIINLNHQNIMKRDYGHSTYIKNVPHGAVIHNIESIPQKKGGYFCRTAGNSALVLKGAVKKCYYRVKLKSGEIRLFHGDSVVV